MIENKRNLPDDNLLEPEIEVSGGSELAVAERVYGPADMVKMSERGMSNPAIGKVVRLTGERVRQIIKKYRSEHGEIERFKADELDINAGIRKNLLASMTADEIKRTKSLRDRAVVYGILCDKAKVLSTPAAGIGITFNWVDIVHQSLHPKKEEA